MFSDFCLRDKRDFIEKRKEERYDAIDEFLNKDNSKIQKALTIVLSKHLSNLDLGRLKDLNKNNKNDIDFDDVIWYNKCNKRKGW